MNILGMNLAGSLMKATDLWYKTLPGLRPAAVAPPRGYTRPIVGPGAIPVLELLGLQSAAEIQNLTPGIHTPVETFFRDNAPGGCHSGGGEAPRNVHEN
jgi:hypothetical protein